MSRDPKAKLDRAYLWVQVCEILKWHNHGNHECIDTLNRLWQKHSEVKSENGEALVSVPVLSEDMLVVSVEHWSLDRLVALKRSHGRDRPLSFPPLVVLRWFDRDPLDQMYRVRHIDALYEKSILFSATQWLLAPSPVKLLYADTLREFWHGIGNAGIVNFGLSIIGYSLPSQDEYARQVLRAIVTNYQRAHWDAGIAGLKKQTLVIVDRCRDAQAIADFKLRYRFLNWDRAILCPGGFDDDAIDRVLAGSG